MRCNVRNEERHHNKPANQKSNSYTNNKTGNINIAATWCVCSYLCSSSNSCGHSIVLHFFSDLLACGIDKARKPFRTVSLDRTRNEEHANTSLPFGYSFTTFVTFAACTQFFIGIDACLVSIFPDRSQAIASDRLQVYKCCFLST